MNIYQKFLNHELLNHSEERHLIGLAHKGCQQSREKLILSNMRLVGWICSKYETETVSTEDLMGDGVEGLIGAIDGFDLTLGTRLSTYASIGIHTAVGRSSALQATIQHPENINQPLKRINKVMADLASEGNLTPSNEEIAEKLENVTPQVVAQIRLLMDTTLGVISMDVPIRREDGKDAYVADFVQYDDPAFQKFEDEMDLDFFLNKLSERDAFVLTRSYGVPIDMTNIEIAKEIKKHPNDITGIRERTLRKCQRIAKYLKSEPILTGCEDWAAIMVDPKLMPEPDGNYQMEFALTF